MLNLSNVTLLCVETREPELAHWAIDRCLRGTHFAKVVLITDIERVIFKRPGIEYIQAPIIRTTEDYSDLILTGIEQYVQGAHVLIIQWDSFVIDPQLWTDEFLNVDYIGPVWPHHPENPVGNGGFSLRSVKLLQAIKRPDFVRRHPEDYCICVDNKSFLEQYCDIQFASKDLAEQFAVERSSWHPAFGFHGLFNFGHVLNDEELSHFLRIIPKTALSGLDTYDLVQSLRDQNRCEIARKIGKRVRFKWKMRKRYIKLQWWLYSF